MKSRLAVGVALLGIATAISLGRVHPFGDARVHAATSGALLKDANMNPEAKLVLAAKCADCHSDQTRWPLYAKIAPGSWLIERDIVNGRRRMNLSHWSELSPDLQQVLEAKILKETKAGDMPPVQYRMLHWSASLSERDVQTLATLSHSAPAESTVTGAGDAVHGKSLFERRCTGCHAIEVDREGPRLSGVFGRKAGSVPGFAYSAGLKNSGMQWTDANLERWLTDPDLFIPDNKMSFSVPKAQERRDLIAYLATH